MRLSCTTCAGLIASSRRWMRFSICSFVTLKAAKASTILAIASGDVSAFVLSGGLAAVREAATK